MNPRTRTIAELIVLLVGIGAVAVVGSRLAPQVAARVATLYRRAF